MSAPGSPRALSLEQLLTVAALCGDLKAIDTHFTETGLRGAAGIVQLKAALVALANVADLEPSIRPTYQAHGAPSAAFAPLGANLAFAKYLRNQWAGHLHPDLLTKAVEWQPVMRWLPAKHADPQVREVINFFLLEVAVNTYVDGNKHRFFDSETDLNYPPNWHRFMEFVEVTIRGAIRYLESVAKAWAPQLSPTEDPGELMKLSLQAGRTEFKYLTKPHSR